jgi:chromosome partitioning protein
VNQLLHLPVQIWGVLPTFYDSLARICREALATMREHFGDRCLDSIRAAMKIKEAPSQGQTIFEYAAGSHASDDYMRVVDRVIGQPSAPAFDHAAPNQLEVISA